MKACRSQGARALALVALIVCAVAPATMHGASEPASDASDQYRVVDCLLPPRMILMGETQHFTPSRPMKASAKLCAKQGGIQSAGLDVWLKFASEGNADAQAYVGEMYQLGTGGAPQDARKAVEWLEKAAAQRNLRAMASLAAIYNAGTGGVGKDPAGVDRLVSQAVQATGADTRNITPVGTPVGRRAVSEATGSVSMSEALRSFEFGRYYALLIGNSDYQNMPRLKSPGHEVDVIGAVLENRYGFKVRTIKNGTKEDIMKALDDLGERLQPQDNLLIHYSGHGYQSETGEGYWLPVNGEGVQSSNKFRTRLWISTAEVREKLALTASLHILVVSDSCYSARFLQFRGFGAAPRIDSDVAAQYLRSFSQLYGAKSRNALTSGGLTPVLEPTDGSMSVFAKAFVRFLERNRDVIPSAFVFTGIETEVMEGSARAGSPQQPQWGIVDGSGHQSGDFYFRPR